MTRHQDMFHGNRRDGEPIHVNEEYHAVDKMNDESDESVHLSLCVYVKDEPVHGNTRVKDER